MSLQPISALKVLKPGLYCAIQDAGRFGYRHLGVPISGAADRHSMIFANSALHNPIQTPVLEIYGRGAEFEVLHPITIMVAGAKTILSIDGKKQDCTSPINLQIGQTLKIEELLLGFATYIAVIGGWVIDPIMGSVSTLHNTHLLPFKKNDVIYIHITNQENKVNYAKMAPIHIDIQKRIEVMPGPEWEILTADSRNSLNTSEYQITKDSNRMGYRLSGIPLARSRNIEMLTSAVCPGTIQLLPDGQLILLMRDCQTTGGYPRILVVEESDLNQLAHRVPGDSVVFLLNTNSRSQLPLL